MANGQLACHEIPYQAVAESLHISRRAFPAAHFTKMAPTFVTG
jgi:hypothetical protein